MAYNKTWEVPSSVKRSIARRLARKHKEASKTTQEGPQWGNPMGMYLVDYIPPLEANKDVWKGYDQ